MPRQARLAWGLWKGKGIYIAIGGLRHGHLLRLLLGEGPRKGGGIHFTVYYVYIYIYLKGETTDMKEGI